jgi:hypothetical protein
LKAEAETVEGSKLEAGNWKLEAGSRKLEAGSRKLEAGSWKLEARIAGKPEAGRWKPEAGSRQLEPPRSWADDGFACSTSSQITPMPICRRANANSYSCLGLTPHTGLQGTLFALLVPKAPGKF